MLTWRGCTDLPLQSLMEPAVVDPDPSVIRVVEDIGIAMAKTNVGMVVGFSGVHGLRRNHVISGHHHHHQRNAGSIEVAGVEPVKRALLVKRMERRPAQGEGGMLVSLQRQLIEPAERLAFRTDFIAQQPQPGGGVADDVVPLIGEAHHQGRPAAMA